MISEADARAQILDSLRPLPPQSLPIADSRGHRVAAPLAAPAPVPRFDQSAMDGYALRATEATQALRVTGEQPAGADRQLRVTPGTTIRIFTGAPLPSGADCVVRQEDVDRVGDTITIREVPCLGEFIRPAGADLCAGQIILRPGDLLIPARIGLLAALGLEDISVHPRPLVGLVSTGDELRPPGHPLSPGEIPDSNRPMLAALLADAGFEVAVSTHARDTPAALATALDATAGCDAVILTGGVSVGEHDHVRAALRDHGVTPDLWRVAVKPGKPFLFGRKDATTFFGLPGNPVSTYVTALLFVLPGLRRLAGATIAQARPQFFDLPTAERLHNPGDRPHYLRGTISQGEFHPASLQESHALASLARSTHLARIDANARIDPGESVACVALSGF